MSFDHDRLKDQDSPRGEIARGCVCRGGSSSITVLVMDLFFFALIVTLVLIVGSQLARGDQEISVKPGRLKKIETKLDGKRVLWRPIGDFDLIEDSGGRYATTLFPSPGKYQIIVVTAKSDEPLVEVITITVDGKPPDPGPDPKPPIPPTPDELVTAIGVAWQMELAPDKATSAKNLAAVYRYGRARLEDSLTWGDVFSRMATQATALDVYGKLPRVQKAIQPILDASLPTLASAKVDAISKAKAGPIFERIATILETLK